MKSITSIQLKKISGGYAPDNGVSNYRFNDGSIGVSDICLSSYTYGYLVDCGEMSYQEYTEIITSRCSSRDGWQSCFNNLLFMADNPNYRP